jgi:hypothetical protein
LLFALGALLPAYACSPEVDNAIRQLQESARTKISAENWLAQIVNETSDYSLLRNATGRDTVKRIREAIFIDKQALIYLKKYLAEVKIQQGTEEYRGAKKILLKDKVLYTYTYTYPYKTSYFSGSTCQLEIVLFIKGLREEGFESSYMYFFDMVNGKMKLIRANGAG